MSTRQGHFRQRCTTLLVAIAAMCASSVLPAQAQKASIDMRLLIERALDEPSGFTITDKTLGEAIGLIAEQTGVPLHIRSDVMAVAPRGAGTMIRKVEIADMPLREGLERVLTPLGMTFAVRDDHVEILAKEPVAALGRPATWEELDTLAHLTHTEPGLDGAALAKMKSMIQFRVTTRDPWSALSTALREAGAGPGDEALSRACRGLGWTWTLDGQYIVIADGVATIRHKLGQRITLRMTNRPLLDVLHTVGKRVGIAVHTEPGLMDSLPRHLQQNFSLNAHDDAAFQIIETITAYTGLGYVIEPGGVFFFHAGDDSDTPAQRKGSGPPTGEDPIVAKMMTKLEDGKTIDWLIRQSELPPNLREMRKKDLAELFRSMRRTEPLPHP